MKTIKNGVRTFGILLWLLAGTVQAQILNSQSSAPDEQEEAAKYEQLYEHVLERALRGYYADNTYLVDVKADVKKVMIPRDYEIVEPPPSPVIENLPGLPVIPPGLRNSDQPEDSIRVTDFDSRYELDQLTIKVLVDTSYSAEDIAFIEEAVIMASNADLMRGDIVEVEQRAFPRNPRDLITPQEPEESAEPKEETAGVEPPVPNEMFGIDWNDPRQLLYVIAGLGILILLLLLFLAFRKPKEREPEPEIQYYPELMPPGEGEGEEENNNLLLKGEVGEVTPETQARFENDKMFITHACISNPKQVSELITSWIETDDEEGILKAVRSIHSVDPRLIDILNPHLAEEHATSIQFGLSGLEPLPLAEKAEEAGNFKKGIRDLHQKSAAKEESENGQFEFLEQLDNQQLMHLVKDESDKMIAILLAQVAGERSSFVLQRLPEQKKLSVLIKMGQINDIPVSVYKKVAAHFSSKALSVSDMKKVAADGVDSILSTVDSLPVDEQDDFVNSIAEQDLELAKKIKRYFISFNDLPKLKSDILQAGIENVHTQKLIMALHNADKEIQQKVLGVRPNREQQLIISELANMHDVSDDEVEQARKDLLREIRQHLKSMN